MQSKKLKLILRPNQRKEMKNKEEVSAELLEISPVLAKMKERKEGFTVPSDYFERMQKEVLQQVALTNEPTAEKPVLGKKRGILQATWFRLAMAAAILGVAICTVLFLYLEQNKPSTQLAKLSDEEVTRYVTTHLDDFEEELLIKNAQEIFEAPTNLIKTEEIDRYFKETLDDLDLEEIENL